ncbi:MAG: metal ABC transporter permease [Muribaculaceae bacterium]|nr:metal ABC transporter permease [Muribaculaceae bacterium]MDE5929886.1 metal ABC transporter permease [Muribaculaceae bacterium]MDE6131405.1 metal ABC transporter permease [Muribaculaceae bacterium]
MTEAISYLHYDFFRYALYGVILISMCAAVIGTYIISRRLVAICGGVTHACFGGLGIGYYLGISPVAMAAVVAIAASAGVEWASGRFRIREDSAIAVIWALGMAVGVLFVFMTPGYVPELNSFLFGNILTISFNDLIAFAIYAAVLGLFIAWRYRMIVACAFDRDFARVSGLPVRFITYSMTVLVAVCIVLTIRLVGVMLLMSMLSLPMMTAEIWCRRFGPMMLWSMVISLLTSVAGLVAGTMIDVPCSALIVLSMAGVFLLSKITATAVDGLRRR